MSHGCQFRFTPYRYNLNIYIYAIYKPIDQLSNICQYLSYFLHWNQATLMKQCNFTKGAHLHLCKPTVNHGFRIDDHPDVWKIKWWQEVRSDHGRIILRRKLIFLDGIHWREGHSNYEGIIIVLLCIHTCRDSRCYIYVRCVEYNVSFDWISHTMS